MFLSWCGYTWTNKWNCSIKYAENLTMHWCTKLRPKCQTHWMMLACYSVISSLSNKVSRHMEATFTAVSTYLRKYAYCCHVTVTQALWHSPGSAFLQWKLSQSSSIMLVIGCHELTGCWKQVTENYTGRGGTQRYVPEKRKPCEATNLSASGGPRLATNSTDCCNQHQLYPWMSLLSIL